MKKLLFKIKGNQICEAAADKLNRRKLADVKIIDVAKQVKLKERYKVKIVPCLLILSDDKDEKVEKRIEGVAVLNEIEKLL